MTYRQRMSVAAVIAVVALAAAAAAGNNPVDENWWPSEFGADDQAGATNTIDPAKRLAAVGLVKRGVVQTLVSVRGLYESDESVIRRPLLKS